MRSLFPTGSISVLEIAHGKETEVFSPAWARKRQVHIHGLIYGLGYPAHCQTSFFVRPQFEMLADRSHRIVDRKPRFFVHFRERHFLLTKRTKYILNIISSPDLPQCKISLGDPAFRSASIAYDKCKIRARKLNVSTVVYDKQIVLISGKCDVPYRKTRTIIGDVRLAENPKLPSNKQQKHEVQTKRELVEEISLNRNVARNLDGKLIFVLSCYAACVRFIADTFHWWGVYLGHLIGFLGFLIIWFNAPPWDWFRVAAVPISGVIMIICGAWAWLWLSGHTPYGV